ncbi:MULTISPECIES: glycosyltransferase [Mucilaginibacter]|jgi:glycosyltransferase involved in cell wall biosynthesis|uniref:glycosyltransferase n=1 Tax=Mucilaginibacter TaxID=423349 RepID=UPI0008716975|nr:MULTISPECIES: glycosyltransferase family 2 protein [Mucilaginibacter]NVM67147.1 glycosyltransferase involved in cell wall biosynthesis [Mucilaginibacter sp. SG538B]GGB18617.1 glycosyl transferase [Mucilaginibacter rubeus]SCW81346.1 Glycosyltransferase, catalytic subunit of cellulose synthase and poly-beta-1,6-N-acetylglucosamine synthase [Mucilaginibacter sp. NFR10]
MILFWYSVILFVSTLALNFYLLIGFKQIKQVSRQPVMDNPPPLAIIIAVRNEEEDLEKALQSVCHINYPNHRLIVVNDRSTDRTTDILKDFSLHYPKLQVTTIDTLPDGWLGKNNALYQGYLSSTEEWMLFADADIVFHPDAINKAVGYAVKHEVDHLTMLPELISRSSILNSVFATLSIMLMIAMKPWEAKKPKSKASSGIGAFNLVRRTAYEKIGTHVRIKLRPDDDLQLGQLIKKEGLRQDVLAGKGYVCLEWYKNLGELGRGVQKNSFAVANYNLVQAIINVLNMLLTVALPMPLMFIFGTAGIRIMAAIMLVSHIIYMMIVPPNKWWYAFMIPFSGLFLAWHFLKASIITVVQGGIYWRESFYSLDMLRGK